MPRAPVTSAASYATFKARALPVLQAAHAATVRDKIRTLYKQCYSRAQHPDLPPKEGLRNQDLLLAMMGVARGIGNRKAKIQNLNWRVMNVGGCAMEYERLLLNPGILLSQEATAATSTYLHVYASNGRAENNNWRIAANVLPVDIPEATRRLAMLEDRFANFGHFKVTAPGGAGKPDSSIIYMTKDAAYAATRDAALEVFGGLQRQETFAPMWDELTPGIAVGAEPPKIAGGGGGPSFGNYRCILTVMAFNHAVATNAGGVAAALTIGDFGTAMDTYFDRYGVPHATPHDQYQIVIGPVPGGGAAARTVYLTQDQWNAYMSAYAQYRGRAANTYDGRGVQNRPAIV